MKKFAFLILILLATACGNVKPHFYVGTSFIQNPDMSMFGSLLTTDGGRYSLKSYFRSSIRNRTEYIFENFDMTIPALLETGREYSFDTPGVTVWYAKGGFAGQIETTNVSGSFTILERTDKSIKIKLQAEFYQFSKEGVWDDPTLPASIRREGVITSTVGYDIY